MSALMLSDENALNQVNPFVVGGPGAWRKPFGFAPASPDKDNITCDAYGCSVKTQPGDLWEPKSEKPECLAGIFAHDNSNLGLYQGCIPPKNPVSCPLYRAAEPTQEFLPDLYTLIPYKDPSPVPVSNTRETVIFSLPIILIVVLLAILLMSAVR
jgi:hypothetical protein